MKIAGIQFSCSEEKEKNTQKAFKMLDLAVEQGARVICFQELFNLRWFPKARDEKAFLLAEPIDGPTVETLRKKAQESDAVILLPFFERLESRYYNSCAVINSDGSLSGVYRKLHLPDIPFWEEKYYFSQGNMGFPVFETSCGCIGVQISWDNLFPEGSRRNLDQTLGRCRWARRGNTGHSLIQCLCFRNHPQPNFQNWDFLQLLQ